MADQSIHTDNVEVMTIYVAWQMAQAIVPKTQSTNEGSADPVPQETYGEQLRAEYAKCYKTIKPNAEVRVQQKDRSRPY